MTSQPQTPLTRASRHSRTNRLLAEARRCSDPVARDEAVREVVVLNMPVARSVASRYRDRGVPIEDLEQVAYTALLRAARRFDPDQADDFLTYAVPSMRGDLKKYFRDVAWVVRPPRRVQEIQTKVLSVERELEHAQGRRPSAAEIAEVVQEDVSVVQEALVAQGCFRPTSLDGTVSSETATPLGDWITDGEDERERAQVEIRVLLKPTLERLRERDRRILHLRFVQGLTQQEIADDLGVTQMQVSRLLARIMRDLRTSLGDCDTDELLTG
jgi:RNA polymerase sigma-B factor